MELVHFELFLLAIYFLVYFYCQLFNWYCAWHQKIWNW